MIITEMSTLERLEDFEIRSEYGAETLKYDVAAALIAARKIKNLTQVAFANIAGVSQAYIAKLESGQANPTIGRIGAILASIWLKSEISLVPIVKSIDSKIAKQTEHTLETSSTISSNALAEIKGWLDFQTQTVDQQSNKRVTFGNEIMGNAVATNYPLKAIQKTMHVTSETSPCIFQQQVPPFEDGINPSVTGARRQLAA
jgi:transcriptional regulator with XRE-family HTH domain